MYKVLLDYFGPKWKKINSITDIFETIAKNIRDIYTNREAKARKQLQKYNEAFEIYKNTLFPFDDELRFTAKYI
ncbi:MAG: hypothetical protein IPQ02_03315 [Saprospiraceae bacterium]|nr:hypothetical protein [Candidatus Defluviibacterium haderslevense]